jgi:hypothetical protein
MLTQVAMSLLIVMEPITAGAQTLQTCLIFQAEAVAKMEEAEEVVKDRAANAVCPPDHLMEILRAQRTISMEQRLNKHRPGSIVCFSMRIQI